MKEVIDSLYELQKIDSQLDEVVSLRGDLPEKVKLLETELEEVREKRDRFNEKYDEVKKEINRHEESINHEKVELEKDEKHIYDVKNNKEYDAITAQIKTRKSAIEEGENAILELQEKEELIKEHVDKYNSEYEKEVSELNVMKEELHNKIAETETREKSLREDRKTAFSEIDDRYLKVYERVRTSKKDAVVLLNRSSCSGCRQVLPRQQQAQIQKQNSIVFCESCGRIIIFDVEAETEKAEA